MRASRQEGTIRLKRFIVGPLATNCYLIHESLSREGMLIDPGCHENDIEDFIRSERVNVTGIINTHGHADHAAGDFLFGFPVMIHELDARFLGNGAVKLLKDGDVIGFGNSRFKVIHTPGHTPGGICLWGEGMLFSGDTLFFECVGRADFPYSDADALLRSIKERLFVLPDDTRVLPGHGPETTIGHEKRFNPYFISK